MTGKRLFRFFPLTSILGLILFGSSAAGQQIEYIQRENRAPDSIKKVLSDLRAKIKAQNFTFEVGYTSALDRKLEQLAGTRAPQNLEGMAREQNKLAQDLMRVDENARNQVKLTGIQWPELSIQCSPAVSAFDWRRLGKVTSIRDQRTCGSCWAFATIGAFEGSYLIRNADGINASEQQVLSCSGVGNCSGGWWAFDFLIHHGVASEANYPYTATDTPCMGNVPSPYRAVAWGYVHANGGVPSVGEMKQALCQYGPLAVAVRATVEFQSYRSGVFNQRDLGNVNHGVTLIGWDDTKNAYLIKNSWGPSWGEDGGFGSEGGFMWIAYDSNSIGFGAAWVRARNNYYMIPSEYYKLLPKIQQMPDPIPMRLPWTRNK